MASTEIREQIIALRFDGAGSPATHNFGTVRRVLSITETLRLANMGGASRSRRTPWRGTNETIGTA